MTKEQRAQTPYVDFLNPIIADADTGFGGIGAVTKLAKMFVERGAAGIHIEDQSTGKSDVVSPCSSFVVFHQQ